MEADAYVVSLGSCSPLLTEKVGVRLNSYPAKGYSATVPVAEYSVWLTHDESKLVFSRRTIGGMRYRTCTSTPGTARPAARMPAVAPVHSPTWFPDVSPRSISSLRYCQSARLASRAPCTSASSFAHMIAG